MAISKVIYKSSASATPVTWIDATPSTAAAADILSPKTAMLADGVVTQGTGSGGITPTGNIDITQAGQTDVTNYATATVPSGALVSTFVASITPTISVDDDGLVAAFGEDYASESVVYQTGWIDNSSTLVVYKTANAQQQLPTQGAVTITPSTTAQTAVAKGKWTTGAVTVAAMPSGTTTAPTSISGTSASISTGTNTLTLTKTVSVTPSVTAGYVASGTAGNSSVSLTASVAVNPTPTASGATVTIPAGYYSSQTTKSVSTTTHPNPTASINSSTGLVTASHTQTAGYVSAGTTTGTLQLTTQAAATITPTTSSQTAVAAGRYTTGAVTVAAIPSNYVDASSLKTYYTGSSAPSSSLGSNGDLYFQTSGA